MRAQRQLARSKRAKHTRHALQIGTCTSILILSCSVYDTDLLSGRGVSQGGDAGADLPDASAGRLPAGNGGAEASEAGRSGEQGQALGGSSYGGDASAGEAGAFEPESGGRNGNGGSGGASGNGGRSGASGNGGRSGASGNGGRGGASGSGGRSGASGNGGNGAGSGASVGGIGGGPPVVKEWAKNKNATASSTESGHDVAKGNDGDNSTRWCAVSAAMPQWWRVDLGAAHELTQVEIKFEHPARKYSYVVETSLNDSVFIQRAKVDAAGDTQTIDMPAGVFTRYLRVTVNAGASFTDGNGTVYPTWASFWELRAYGY
jgi:hypothetical protein